MKFKTLILGSAAAFAVTGAAQAADLAVAEPVEYVKVCDAYGTGFFYVPSTDTCLKIGARVRFDGTFSDSGRGFGFNTKGYISATGQWQTELGEGKLFIEAEGSASDADDDLGLGDVYFKIGPWLFGYTGSVANGKGGYTDFGGYRNDHATNQISWSGSLGGLGVAVGIEEGTVWGDSWDTLPDLALAITGSMGPANFKATAAVVDRVTGTGYGVNFGAEADLGGFMLLGNVAWSHDAPALVGGTSVTTAPFAAEGDWWSVLGSFKMPAGAGIAVVGTVSMVDGPAGGDVDTTTAAALGIQADLTTNVSGWIEGMWSTTNGVDTWKVGTRLQAKTPGT